MYERSAAVYDLMNAATGKDYAAEAATVLAEVRARTPDARTLLDVACGTGAHLEHLRRELLVTGVDLEGAMLDIARRRLPDVSFHAGDMRSFDLGVRFDVVTCLFSAVGYMLVREDLEAAMATMARHLLPGGVLLVEPWFHPDQWLDGHVVAVAANGPGTAVARVSRSTRSGRLSRFDFHYAIASGDGVETFVEPHEAALWTVEEYLQAIEAAGLEAGHGVPGLSGRGLLVGRAPV